ncbi:MAG: substrate-binding domain-containing protein [Proteobacteria bacterium]|nr:substrate-binding domain-containing protein [Pseudomonadota bacterium]
MKNSRLKILRLIAIGILTVAVLVFTFLDQVSAAEDIYFICNKNIPVNTLSRNDIKNIFIGKKTTWDNQQKITFVVLKTENVYKEFLLEYLRKNKQQYELYWRQMIFTGEGFFPKFIDSEDKLIKFVAETDGAIGFLSHETDNDTVKIISISN